MYMMLFVSASIKYSMNSNVCIWVFGGKDSSVMLQLTNHIAAERGRTSRCVFYFDFEAQYKATIDHVYELKSLSQINEFYHFCLPLENEDNPSSIFRPTWDEKEKHLWVRDLPGDAIDIDTVDPAVFVRGQEWEQLIVNFPRWLKDKYGTDKVACLVGCRIISPV